jgi:hybrid cluster-associated redox disulfide protein
MIQIARDTVIGDILDVAPQTAPIFLSIGMHCLGCPSSRGETVEEACMVHGLTEEQMDKLLEVVNEEANRDFDESENEQ